MDNKKNPTLDGQGREQGLSEESFVFSVDRDLDKKVVTISTDDGAVTIPEKWVPTLVDAINGLFVEAEGHDVVDFLVISSAQKERE